MISSSTGVRRVKGKNVATAAWLDRNRTMVFQVTGLVTPGEGDMVVKELREGVKQFRPFAIMADYRNACMAADPRTMVDCVDKMDRRSRLLNTPAAALVSSCTMETWREYSRLMKEHLGFTRGAFDSSEHAMTWLSRQMRADTI